MGPPIATLLVAELFVSEWPRSWSLQTLRWAGMLLVGSLAAIVSWSHINELLSARGQNTLVAVLWPLAIDGMAIFAMAKLLAMRVHRGHADADIRQRAGMSADRATFDAAMSTAMAVDMDTRDTIMRANVAADTTDADMDWSYKLPPEASESADTPRSWADLVGADNRLMDWVSGQEHAHADIADTLAAEAEAHLSAVMSAPSLPKRTRTASGASAPAEFVSMAAAWDPIELDRADMVKLSAAYFGVSDRTARRWLSAVTGAPMSGPPEQS